MKLGELLDQLGIGDANENEREYEVSILVPDWTDAEVSYTVKSVMWDHQNHHVTIEIESIDA